MWLASFKQHSAVHGEVGRSATSAGLRALAGCFDVAKGGSIDTGDGRRAVSSSPGWRPRTAGGSSEMPGDAEEGIEVEMLPPVLSLEPCGGGGCCPRPPVPWRWGRPGTIAGPWAAGGSGEMPGDAEEGTIFHLCAPARKSPHGSEGSFPHKQHRMKVLGPTFEAKILVVRCCTSRMDPRVAKRHREMERRPILESKEKSWGSIRLSRCLEELI